MAMQVESVSGNVSSNGQPLPNVSVQITDMQGTVSAWTLTQADGSYAVSIGLELAADEVNCNVMVQALGYKGKSSQKHTKKTNILANFSLERI